VNVSKRYLLFFARHKVYTTAEAESECGMNMVNVKSKVFPSCKAHRAAPISVSLALSHTSVCKQCMRDHGQGASVSHRAVCLLVNVA